MISGYLEQLNTILNGHLLTIIASPSYKLEDLDQSDPSKYVIQYTASFFESNEGVLIRAIISS